MTQSPSPIVDEVAEDAICQALLNAFPMSDKIAAAYAAVAVKTVASLAYLPKEAKAEHVGAEGNEPRAFYWRALDPDDNGDNPAEALNVGMVGAYTVCEVACSFNGPTRFGFIAPVLDAESDDEEFLHFATKDEAILASGERRSAIDGAKDTSK